MKTSTTRNGSEQIDKSVTDRLQECPYKFVFNKVRWQFTEGRLILQGCVPTFYLKQVLQEMLRGIEHVDEIQNNVDVVSSTGLSS